MNNIKDWRVIKSFSFEVLSEIKWESGNLSSWDSGISHVGPNEWWRHSIL